MKKKSLFTAAAAAALIFTGVGVKEADASTIKNVNIQTVAYKVNSQEDLQKVLDQYLAKYNIPVNYNISINKQFDAVAKQYTAKPAAPVKQPAKAPVAQPVEKPVQAPTAPTQTQTPPAQKPTNSGTPTSSTISQFEKEVVELTNAERAKNGLKALTIDTELSKVARAKSQDMKDRNYFDHTSPTYGSPFDMMKQFGISYSSAGENIAKGQTTPQQVVQAWMNSEGHRANILNASYTHIGVGYVQAGNYWTQMFIGK
ncbi:CAP domain-containing protein [Bacillus cihuensis]|uniref:CAP domain-containing protein n=1 Tax=Bacillus cihuensis TaxID=1208599 RepID=UPI000415C593|nr:CAP domain-containing protein [Bacillus cihuensis]